MDLKRFLVVILMIFISFYATNPSEIDFILYEKMKF